MRDEILKFVWGFSYMKKGSNEILFFLYFPSHNRNPENLGRDNPKIDLRNLTLKQRIVLSRSNKERWKKQKCSIFTIIYFLVLER